MGVLGIVVIIVHVVACMSRYMMKCVAWFASHKVNRNGSSPRVVLTSVPFDPDSVAYEDKCGFRSAETPVFWVPRHTGMDFTLEAHFPILCM